MPGRSASPTSSSNRREYGNDWLRPTWSRNDPPGEPASGKRELAAVGTLSLRAGVGNRARRLQPRRRGLGLSLARSGASRAYRWSEDGLGGVSDDRQHLCFAPALWNGRDPILKERAFGLTGAQGNHGEDVKEYYFYLDATPTHSLLRYLYKYPHS